MPHDASWEASIFWHLGHMQRTSMGEARALFCRKLMEAQEARKKWGSDTKKNNGGGRLITQAKVWL
jgi:hypothetical protein